LFNEVEEIGKSKGLIPEKEDKSLIYSSTVT